MHGRSRAAVHGVPSGRRIHAARKVDVTSVLSRKFFDGSARTQLPRRLFLLQRIESGGALQPPNCRETSVTGH